MDFESAYQGVVDKTIFKNILAIIYPIMINVSNGVFFTVCNDFQNLLFIFEPLLDS